MSGDLDAPERPPGHREFRLPAASLTDPETVPDQAEVVVLEALAQGMRGKRKSLAKESKDIFHRARPERVGGNPRLQMFRGAEIPIVGLGGHQTQEPLAAELLGLLPGPLAIPDGTEVEEDIHRLAVLPQVRPGGEQRLVRPRTSGHDLVEEGLAQRLRVDFSCDSGRISNASKS